VEYLKSIFVFNEKAPLIFTQMYFWGFFAIVLAIFSLLYKRITLRNAYLFFVSLFFYYKTSGIFVSILLFSTLSDFYIAKFIYQTSSLSRKKWLLSLSVFVNLFVLFYFKYSYFVTDSINSLLGTNIAPHNYFAEFANFFGGNFNVDRILLPVGISFYTFQTISYSVDVFREKIKPVKNILDFGFYVSFFPQLVAGPIVRASEFIPQLYKDYKLSQYEFGLAIFWILKGLLKKMFISDYIAVNFIDRVFENPMAYTGFENLMALYGYSLQVYADFSGYTDIAIGVALLMGFYLPTNFNSPYKALDVSEFWKRWHISLSTWLKDYLYIPIGGNRKGSIFSYVMFSLIMFYVAFLFNHWSVIPIFLILLAFVIYIAKKCPRIRRAIDTNINLMLTMLLGGLWHGASWRFVIWGGLNGIGLVVYKYWKRISPFKNTNNWFIRIYAIFLTFNFISFTRIWFRADSLEQANNLMYKIGNDWTFSLIPAMLVAYKEIFSVILLGMIIHWLSDSFKQKYQDWFIHSSIYVKGAIAILVFFIIYQVRSADLQPFIYFQF
jgi:D-alanyl-lipoteichoic acid acyltransferase DltB (MBOAT superfamily)